MMTTAIRPIGIPRIALISIQVIQTNSAGDVRFHADRAIASCTTSAKYAGKKRLIIPTTLSASARRTHRSITAPQCPDTALHKRSRKAPPSDAMLRVLAAMMTIAHRARIAAMKALRHRGCLSIQRLQARITIVVRHSRIPIEIARLLL